MTWNGPVDVLCHATGAYYAMLLSQKSPDLFSRMIITSINLMKDDKTNGSAAAKFLGGIHKLAQHSGMYETLVRQFQKTTFSNGRATRFVLRRLFRECASDLDALDGVVGHGPAFNWYQALHAASMVGIASDFSLVNVNAGNDIAKLNVPMVFLHAPDDCFTTLDEMRAYTDLNSQAELRPLRSGGHLAIASHAEMFWSEIERALAE